MTVERGSTNTTTELSVPGSLLADYLQAADELGVRVGEIRFAGDEEIKRDEDGDVVNENCRMQIDLGAIPNTYTKIIQRVSELTQRTH